MWFVIWNLNLPNTQKTIFILSVSSDIGRYLAKRYLAQGHRVIGTFRSRENLKELMPEERCHLIRCDIGQNKDIKEMLAQVKKLRRGWDVFISSVGHPLPLQPFFEADFEEWSESVHVNSIDQLRVLHGLYPFRNKKSPADVIFFAGIASNNAVPNYSAYGISKIMLTKMTELLDFENKDLNVFIVGPGKTKTKMHYLVMNDPHTLKEKYLETKKLMEKEEGTPLQDIYQCIEWLRREGKPIAGGRNFSVVYDPWRPHKRESLSQQLKSDFDMYKLRRHNNDFLQKGNREAKARYLNYSK